MLIIPLWLTDQYSLLFRDFFCVSVEQTFRGMTRIAWWRMSRWQCYVRSLECDTTLPFELIRHASQRNMSFVACNFWQRLRRCRRSKPSFVPDFDFDIPSLDNWLLHDTERVTSLDQNYPTHRYIWEPLKDPEFFLTCLQREEYTVLWCWFHASKFWWKLGCQYQMMGEQCEGWQWWRRYHVTLLAITAVSWYPVRGGETMSCITLNS